VDVEVHGGERGNVQTGGGDRVSTISLLGCSTSMALATGPTNEEEEVVSFMSLCIFYILFPKILCTAADHLHKLGCRIHNILSTINYVLYV